MALNSKMCLQGHEGGTAAIHRILERKIKHS